jgi:hypothetical protein
LENCAGWGAQSIMAEVFLEGNVEKQSAVIHQATLKRTPEKLV